MSLNIYNSPEISNANYNPHSLSVPKLKEELFQNSNNSLPIPTKEGSFFSKIANSIGNAFSSVVKTVANFGTDVVKGSFNAVRGIGFNLYETASDAFSGVSNLFKINLADGIKNIGSALIKTIQTPIDAVISAVANPLLSIGTKSEKLENPQKEIGKEIFEKSLNLDSVRIKRLPKLTSALTSKLARAFVIGNDIFVPHQTHLENGDKKITENNPLLAHELTHVWQHQNGGTDFTTEALFAQHLGDGYSIPKDKKFAELNPEQQGQVIELIQKAKDAINRNEPYISVLTHEQIEDALSSIRKGKGAP